MAGVDENAREKLRNSLIRGQKHVLQYIFP